MAEELVRVQYVIFPTREAALAAGWPDAEYGSWQEAPGSTRLVSGWIVLAKSDQMD